MLQNDTTSAEAPCTNDAEADLAAVITAMQKMLMSVGRPYIVTVVLSSEEYAQCESVRSFLPEPSIVPWSAITIRASPVLRPGQRLAQLNNGEWVRLGILESETLHGAE